MRLSQTVLKASKYKKQCYINLKKGFKQTFFETRIVLTATFHCRLESYATSWKTTTMYFVWCKNCPNASNCTMLLPICALKYKVQYNSCSCRKVLQLRKKYFVWFLLRDARSAKRGIAIVSRPSVRPSVCLFVCLSVCDVDVPWAYRLD